MMHVRMVARENENASQGSNLRNEAQELRSGVMVSLSDSVSGRKCDKSVDLADSNRIRFVFPNTKFAALSLFNFLSSVTKVESLGVRSR